MKRERNMLNHRKLFWRLSVIVFLASCARLWAAKLVDVSPLDNEYLMIHLLDGDVTHLDNGQGQHAFKAHHHIRGQDTVKLYEPAVNTSAATQPASWTLASAADAAYGISGKHPRACHRKTKVNGHAEKEWSGSDYVYEYTYEHFLYLHLPSKLKQGTTYTLTLDQSINSDVAARTFTFDIYTAVSEAVHVNLVGYHPQSPAKSADLYVWMGDGGARDYTDYAGNTVYLYDVTSGQSHNAGAVSFWKQSGQDVGWYNLTRSAVWNADFAAFATPGTWRLAIEGVGCSQDFELGEDIYYQPFRTCVQGFFYMRIGQDSTGGIRPVPRRPLYLPDTDPPQCKVYLTTMHPWHNEWSSFSSGDVWDNPDDWKRFRKSGNPANPHAWGGHSDALDWDRHLGHISIIYDLLLPFVLTGGSIDNDDLGIAESGNGIPDIVDEARNEVDFWLRLRDGRGYAHGLTNPNNQHELFQAAPTAVAAWANAANAAMLADCFRLAGNQSLMETYRDSAVKAFTYASNLSNQMLDEKQNIGESQIRGRDLKMQAAAYLFNVSGDTYYEDIVKEESVCTGPQAILDDYGSGSSLNQIWATAGYLMTPQSVNYPGLYAYMKASIIRQAINKEAGLIASRPSRRATDKNAGYFRTIHHVHRTMIAHAITDDASEKELFRKAMELEADYGLGRNPLNMIQMTTATTPLAGKRSVQGAYTSGRNDGSPGLHPGHTPYMNLDDWFCGMTMGCPSRLHEKSYPTNFKNTWPIGEGYFNTRYVWAHNEFTPQQTMRGKTALYGYLYGLGSKAGSVSEIAFDKQRGDAAVDNSICFAHRRLSVQTPGEYTITLHDLAGRALWVERHTIGAQGLHYTLPLPTSSLSLMTVRGNGAQKTFRLLALNR
ncbi:MAG: glycosyl hydrolase family 5 [Chitinivibrionales bacterium]|nr:glycosyl hydrolase family 5 [Chitinivibrionales bacterium]